MTSTDLPKPRANGAARQLDFSDVAGRFPGAGTLVKGIQLVEVIARHRSASTGVLLRETGLPKATFYRLLHALQEYGYVRQDPDTRECALGARFIELGHHVLSNLDLREASAHEVARLAGSLDETVSLAMLDAERIVHVDVRRGRNPLAVGIELGHGIEAAQSASGLAILSVMPPHDAMRLLEGLDPDARRDTLSAIAMTRARGYAIAPSRMLDGVVVIAAPVTGPRGSGRASITVTALEARMDAARRHVVGRDVMDAARRISGHIGSAPMSISSRPRPSQHVEEGLECVVPAGAIVGEGPAWDARAGRLRWVDVAAPAFHVFDPTTRRASMREAPYLVSAILPAGTGLVAVTQGGVERYDPETGDLDPILHPEAHLPSNRLNDAKADPAGRLWVGSMSLDATMPSGSLHRIDRAGAQAMDGGFQVSNGLGWSPDGATLYFVDSGLGTIYAYAFDPVAGTVSGRRVLRRFDPEDGKPDGLAMDAEGCLWVAMWDGWCVLRLAPDGQTLRRIDMPVPRPTSCCFGGPDLRTLYVTSASIRLPAEVLEDAPLSGGLFALPTSVQGVPIPPLDI
ncbi:MAG: SMP-30/gluconolactonase/LRE family protein [Paracoccaceae bacterium]